MKVCIIGAGTGGLCSARHAILNDIEPTVFEQTSKIGGTWVYTDQIGTDEYGIDIHTSMYRGLRTNLPKEIMGFPDFSIKPKHESNESYVSANVILRFLEDYADYFNLKQYINFLHHVIRVRPLGKQWEVIVRDLKKDITNKLVYDFVLVCNGHYHTPQYPNLKGLQYFTGKQLHSHDFRFSDSLKGEAVLVIGAGPSGMDLCNEISKVAQRVTLSHHLSEMPKTKFSDNVNQKCDVKEIYADRIQFWDGSYDTYTAIIYCTGYKYAFPFISVECGIYVENNFVHNLYKHCINIKFPTMAFIGLPYYVCAAQMMDLQTRFALKFFSGKIKLPSKRDMQLDTDKDMENRRKKGYQKHQAHMMGPIQMAYYDDLAKIAEIERIKPVMSKLHNESSQRFLEDLLNFRNENFKIINDEDFVKPN